MSDGFIQAPPDSTGKRVDSNEVTNSSGVTVERLRMAVPDGVRVSGDLLELMYREMRLTSDLLAQAFGVDVENLRQSEPVGGDNVN